MKLRPALTLIELLLVISLICILSVPIVLSIPNIKQKQALMESSQDLFNNLNRARVFAREGKDDTGWGIVKTGVSSYILARGNIISYSAVTQVNLTPPAVFASGDSVWFDQGTGDIPNNLEMVLAVPNGDTQKIMILKGGVIRQQ